MTERAARAARVGAETDARVNAGRTLLLAAGASIAAGLAVAGSLSQVAGGVLVVIGWLAAVAGLHRFGRAGSALEERDNGDDGSDGEPEGDEKAP